MPTNVQLPLDIEEVRKIAESVLTARAERAAVGKSWLDRLRNRPTHKSLTPTQWIEIIAMLFELFQQLNSRQVPLARPAQADRDVYLAIESYLSRK